MRHLIVLASLRVRIAVLMRVDEIVVVVLVAVVRRAMLERARYLAAAMVV
jgi:hypothetical protein